MDIQYFDLLKWSFNNISAVLLQEYYTSSKDFTAYLTKLQTEKDNFESFGRKSPKPGVAETIAVNKVLKIKEASAAKKKYTRRAKTTKQRIQQLIPEIQALRNGGVYGDVEIESCTWSEIVLYLKQKGIKTTASYIRTIYYAEIPNDNGATNES